MRGPPNLSCPHGARHSTLRPSWRDNATRFPNWNSIWSSELGTEPPLRATIMRYALCRIVRGYATGQKYLDIRLFLIQFSCQATDRTRLKQGRSGNLFHLLNIMMSVFIFYTGFFTGRSLSVYSMGKIRQKCRTNVDYLQLC